MAYPFPYLDFPPAIQATIREYEAELDLIHPGWRIKARWGPLAYDRLARLKWLLKRHALLTTRDAANQPAPRDWQVMVVKGKDGACFAHSIPPSEQAPAATFEPVPIAMPAAEPEAPRNAAAIAFAADVPIERIEAAIAHLGDDAREVDIVAAARLRGVPDYANAGTE